MLMFYLLSLIMITSDILPVYVFDSNSNMVDWQIVDDVVMGGQSQGQFYISDKGYGVFHGSVSLENNGGFSSLRHTLENTKVDGYSKIELKLKGDGKRYQLRVKSNAYDKSCFT